MDLTTTVTLIGEIGVLVGVITPVIVWIRKIANGQRCQLRSEMLQIYYRNREKKTIRQYEYENFVYLYEAYKALKGNSFIDKIYEEEYSPELNEEIEEYLASDNTERQRELAESITSKLENVNPSEEMKEIVQMTMTSASIWRKTRGN